MFHYNMSIVNWSLKDVLNYARKLVLMIIILGNIGARGQIFLLSGGMYKDSISSKHAGNGWEQTLARCEGVASLLRCGLGYAGLDIAQMRYTRVTRITPKKKIIL